MDRIRRLLSGGDRRGIAESNRVRPLVERDPSLVGELAALTADEDWLVAQRALDLLEKLAHDHPDWIAPHKKIVIGPLADSDKWEIRLQIVRALPLFRWSPAQARRVEQILLENVRFPQTFVRAWALERIRTRLPQMLTRAGAGAAAAALDAAALEAILPRVAEAAYRARYRSDDAAAERAALAAAGRG